MVYSHFTPRYRGDDPIRQERSLALRKKEKLEWLTGPKPKNYVRIPDDPAKLAELLKGKSEHVKSEIMDSKNTGFIYIPSDEQVRERQERETREQNESIVELVLEYKHERRKYLEYRILHPWLSEDSLIRYASCWGGSCEVIRNSHIVAIMDRARAEREAKYNQTPHPQTQSRQAPRKRARAYKNGSYHYPKQRRIQHRNTAPKGGLRDYERRGPPRKLRRVDASSSTTRRSSYMYYGPTPRRRGFYYGPTQPHASGSYSYYGPTLDSRNSYY